MTPPPRNPIVVRDTPGVDRECDVYFRLLTDRIVFLGTLIDEATAGRVVAQLLYLQTADPKRDIRFYINSPGGNIPAGLAIYDTMRSLGCDVNTYCIGQAAGMGVLLLAAGTPGKRHAHPNASIMIQEMPGRTEGRMNSVDRELRQLLKLKQRVNSLLAKHTGRTVESVEQDCDRAHFMSGEEARAYGLVDAVIEFKSDVPAATEDPFTGHS